MIHDKISNLREEYKLTIERMRRRIGELEKENNDLMIKLKSQIEELSILKNKISD